MDRLELAWCRYVATQMMNIGQAFEETVLSTAVGFRLYMAARWGTAARDLPRFQWMNAALKTRAQIEEAVAEAKRLRLPPCPDPAKTWDTLAALRQVLEVTGPDARILDAGAEMYSRLLPWLYLYGYRQLFGNNLVFRDVVRRGPIVYQPGDLTRTDYPAGSFDAITCLSVIEHGVDLNSYFAEMSRLLKPGGCLITSTDYFETPTDTRGQEAYGVPIRVLTKDDIEHAFVLAERHGFSPRGQMDFSSGERLVRWDAFDLTYTFAVFALFKSR